MVDRNTPEITDGDRAEITQKFSYVDDWPVVYGDFNSRTTSSPVCP